MKVVTNKKLYKKSKNNLIVLYVFTALVLVLLFFIIVWGVREFLEEAFSTGWHFV